jgi:hypothetical protein
MRQVVDVLAADTSNVVSNGTITNETTLRENPDLIRRMVSASLCKIQYTMEHPYVAFEICFDYV